MKAFVWFCILCTWLGVWVWCLEQYTPESMWVDNSLGSNFAFVTGEKYWWAKAVYWLGLPVGGLIIFMFRRALPLWAREIFDSIGSKKKQEEQK